MSHSVYRGTLLLCFVLLSGGFLSAQEMPAPPSARPSGNAIYGVTSIDVPAIEISQGVALLKKYRAAALKQDGNQGVELLQQMGWPNRFVIYEAWKDQSAYDANQKAPHTASFCAKLISISNATCDRRDYYEVSVGTTRTATGPNSIYMMLHLDVSPSRLDKFFVIAAHFAEAARKGDGNLRYDVASGVRVPWNYMTLFASWENRKAFNDYEMSAYARQFRDQVADVLGSPYDDRLYTEIN